jgi:hypothetical protein
MHLSCYWRYLSREQMTTSSSLSCLEPARPDCRGWVGSRDGDKRNTGGVSYTEWPYSQLHRDN